jgi:coenzyme F420-reducing hydrogenase alpha subunit
MTTGAPAGEIFVTVGTMNGCVHQTGIVSDRATQTVRVFVSRSAEEVVSLAQRLFALCPAAQSLAAQSALEAAQDVDPSEVTRIRRGLCLLAERFSEMLRASVLDWPRAREPEAETLKALRVALTALRALAQEANASGRTLDFPDSMRRELEQARRAAGSLGLRTQDSPAHQHHGFLARILAEAAQDTEFRLPARTFDPLSAKDDAEVARALALAPQEFSRAPALHGRIAETGANARRCGKTAGSATGGDGVLVQRLSTRFEDMAATLATMDAIMSGAGLPEDLFTARSEGRGHGFTAVESARGRLFHQVRLDQGGRVEAYAILAPTEWNFHAAGPFAGQLNGAMIGYGQSARDRVARLGVLFDPCVRLNIAIEEQGHA